MKVVTKDDGSEKIASVTLDGGDQLEVRVGRSNRVQLHIRGGARFVTLSPGDAEAFSQVVAGLAKFGEAREQDLRRRYVAARQGRA